MTAPYPSIVQGRDGLDRLVGSVVHLIELIAYHVLTVSTKFVADSSRRRHSSNQLGVCVAEQFLMMRGQLPYTLDKLAISIQG